jgi:hypothetical protein
MNHPSAGKSIMVSNLFNQVTTETTHCAYAAYTGAPLWRRGQELIHIFFDLFLSLLRVFNFFRLGL